MQELIDDLRAALDQMNRSLSEIAKQNEEQTELLKKLLDELDKKF